MTDEPLNGVISVPTLEDLKYLREKLRQAKLDCDDLERRIVFVIKHGDVVSGCVAARLVFQIEPLYLTPEFTRDASPVTLRRTVFKLANAMMGWLAGPENQTGIRWAFAYIVKKPMQEATKEYGFTPVYRRGKFFAHDF
jgi:hypothetical protein